MQHCLEGLVAALMAGHDAITLLAREGPLCAAGFQDGPGTGVVESGLREQYLPATFPLNVNQCVHFKLIH